ncbi:type VI secretion system tube protein Hcp [Dyadobacter sp. CY345]|uniref:type VI secretion system tube protein Hcp n=1 Tax=Dyadobacter sp. CY345 TaxID=2909335 RepID=UPI001F3F5840|nr:type VI secretion system tube protein Hcp [Dyadobacter sp. CY345]MCF2446315.1 type VI secretion system tube protein Hcp [Dyadobacter sp. CY345]
MKKIYVALAGLLFTFLITGTVMAQKMYIKCIDDSNNELTTNASPFAENATDNGKTVELKNYMEVSSIQFSTDQAYETGSTPGGMNPGRVAFGDFSFTTFTNIASTKLLMSQARGFLLKTVEVVILASDQQGKSIVTHKILLGNAGIKNFSASAAGDCGNGCAGTAESYSLQYVTLQIFTYSQRPDGRVVQNPSPFGWDRIRNVAL